MMFILKLTVSAVARDLATTLPSLLASLALTFLLLRCKTLERSLRSVVLIRSFRVLSYVNSIISLGFCCSLLHLSQSLLAIFSFSVSDLLLCMIRFCLRCHNHLCQLTKEKKRLQDLNCAPPWCSRLPLEYQNDLTYLEIFIYLFVWSSLVYRHNCLNIVPVNIQTMLRGSNT
jgi:hypothetical protein